MILLPRGMPLMIVIEAECVLSIFPLLSLTMRGNIFDPSGWPEETEMEYCHNVAPLTLAILTEAGPPIEERLIEAFVIDPLRSFALTSMLTLVVLLLLTWAGVMEMLVIMMPDMYGRTVTTYLWTKSWLTGFP